MKIGDDRITLIKFHQQANPVLVDAKLVVKCILTNTPRQYLRSAIKCKEGIIAITSLDLLGLCIVSFN
jgi:hypothetical protein